MKRNSNKYLLLGIIMALVIALTGCGGAGVLPDDLTETGSSDVVTTQQAPQNIILSTQDVSCPVGGEMSLDISVEPADASNDLTITSNDPTIAEIDSDGNIIARQRGTAVITISSELNPDVSTSVTVTVTATFESLGIDAEIVVVEEMGISIMRPSYMATESVSENGVEYYSQDFSKSYHILREVNDLTGQQVYGHITLFGQTHAIYLHERNYYFFQYELIQEGESHIYQINSVGNNFQEIEAFINGLSAL